MLTSRVGFMATSACPLQRERRLRDRRVRLVPPRAANSTSNDHNKSLVDRRDVLLGLGGTTAAAAATVMTPGGVILPVMAAPIAPPNLSKCHPAKTPDQVDNNCCLPYTSTNIIDYDFPRMPLRVRRPAHEVKDDEEYMAKYKEAVKKMKELDSKHPWNFYQQALVHCAFCNEAYDQVGYDDVAKLQVHYSWLFLPWHRYYLHFFERILGKLIDDDTFTLPYWNFDAEEGMTVPEIFTYDTSSPLYNDNRDKNHYHPAILDYKYAYSNTAGSGVTGKDLVQANMSYMQSTFKNSLQLAELFMGDPLRAGEQENKGSGGLESIHNGIHQWVGPAESPHTDMGDFSTAARDCVFYSLHANVDRLWHLYRGFRGNRVEFNEPDWLDSSFIFYDEHERVVSVKVRDCLNPTKLRYTYEEVPIPWMGSLRVQKKAKETRRKQDLNLVRIGEFGTKPRELGTTPLRVMVPRPKVNRKKTEKDEKVELIQIKDIQVTSHGPARFDVYVATPYGDLAGPDFGEFVGSFVKLPHKMGDHQGNNGAAAKAKGKKTSLKLGLSALLEDIEAEDAEKLVVTIKPAGGDVTIGGIQIKLVQADSPKLIA